jgi:hypothetical protein
MNTTQAPTSTQPQYEITSADRERIEAIQLAWQAHDGELKKPLVPMPDETDMNVMGNEVMPAVNAIVDFVFGDEVEISVGQSDPADAQKFLDDVWGRKETRIPLLQRLLMNGDASGRAFMRIVPSSVKTGKQQKFRLIEVDPITIFVQTAPQDCQTVLLFCIQYSCDGKNALGKPVKVYYREEISRVDPDQDGDDGRPFDDEDATWIIQHWTQELQSGNMQPTNNNWIPAGDPILWPYPFPPIFSCQNLPKPNDFWGYPGINKSLIGINNAINFINSNINVTEKIQRILYAPGMGEGSINITPGKIVQLPLPENEIKAVNMQSNTANSREFAGDLRGEVEELTGVPMIASGRTAYMPSGPQSGIAIKLLFMSLLKKMNKMRCLYGELIIDVSKALLILAGFKGEDIDITLGWQNPLPVDEYQDLQAAQLKIAIGVSKTTVLKEFGYDPIEEAKLRAEEAAEALKNNPLLQQSPLQGDGQQDQNGQGQNVQQDTSQDQQNGQQSPIGQKG